MSSPVIPDTATVEVPVQQPTGAAATISTAISVVGALALAFPKVALFQHTLALVPMAQQVIPLAMTVGGAIYGAMSHPPAFLRRIFGKPPVVEAAPATPKA